MSISGLSPQGIVFGGLMSSAAIKIGNYFSNQDKTWRGHAIAFGILGIGALSAPSISTSLSKWTGVALNQRQSLLIFGVAATLKAVAIACVRFVFIKKVEGPEEARQLYNLQLSPLHIHYKKEPKAFYEMDLHTQSTLNKRFAENDLSPIPFKEFSAVGTGYSQDEVVHLGRDIDLNNLSQKDRVEVALFLYDNNHPPITCVTREDFSAIPVEDLSSEQIANLSPTQIRWIHLAIRNLNSAPKNRQPWQDLAQAFFDAKLPPPSKSFFLEGDEPVFPKSLDDIQKDEVYLISWLRTYYSQKVDKWSLLPLKVQIQLNQSFSPKLVLFPSDDSFPMGDDLVRYFHQEYRGQKRFWHTLPLSVQKTLNAEFKRLNLTPFAYIDTEAAEDIDATLQLINSYPFLYERMSEEHQKLICKRCYHFLNTHPIKPLMPMWNKMVTEKQANDLRTVGWGIFGFMSLLLVISVRCFTLLEKNPFVIDSSGLGPDQIY